LDRLNYYTIRLKISSLIIIIFSLLQILIWERLNFYEIDKNNTLFVYFTNGILIVIELIALINFILLHKVLDAKVVDRVTCIFYSILISFIFNLIQTLYTLFGSYLKYFKGK